MDAITLRENGTESPNIGTVQCHGMSPMYSVEAMMKALVSHYDCDVIFFLNKDHVEELNRKGEVELELTVNSTTPYKTILTLEVTWIY